MMDEMMILKAEHDLLQDAQEWIAIDKNSAERDLQYVCGIVEMTTALLKAVKQDGNG